MSSCYTPYEKAKEKKELIQKTIYLGKIDCCDKTNCDALLNDIVNTKQTCNTLFKPSNNVNRDYSYEKNAFVKENACATLTDLERKISDKSYNLSRQHTGGKGTNKKSIKKKSIKKKSIKKKSIKKKSRTKKHKVKKSKMH